MVVLLCFLFINFSPLRLVHISPRPSTKKTKEKVSAQVVGQKSRGEFLESTRTTTTTTAKAYIHTYGHKSYALCRAWRPSSLASETQPRQLFCFRLWLSRTSTVQTATVRIINISRSKKERRALGTEGVLQLILQRTAAVANVQRSGKESIHTFMLC